MLQDGPFTLRASLEGMDPDDFVSLAMPADCLNLSVSQLVERAFPEAPQERETIAERFDRRANPDLPDIYAVFLAACDEWRDWRCALRLTGESGEEVAFNTPVSQLMTSAQDPPQVSLHIEQDYRAIEYAVRHGFWSSHDELLGWMRGLTTLYFIDKHEVPLHLDSVSAPALGRALDSLLSVGLVSPSLASPSEEGLPGEPSPLAITSDGRILIASLLGETESLIDQYDHFKDTLVDLELELAEFDTDRGTDLRVEVFLAESIDPVRAVFLLRLYDGTLDRRLPDWQTAIEDDSFYEGILEPVVNRESADATEMELVMESGLSWLEERAELERREKAEREIIQQAEGELPSP